MKLKLLCLLWLAASIKRLVLRSNAALIPEIVLILSKLHNRNRINCPQFACTPPATGNKRSSNPPIHNFRSSSRKSSRIKMNQNANKANAWPTNNTGFDLRRSSLFNHDVASSFLLLYFFLSRPFFFGAAPWLLITTRDPSAIHLTPCVDYSTLQKWL